MSEVPTNVAAARQQAITTDYYALGYLALCVASYADESASPEKIEEAVATDVPRIGKIGDVPGTWTLDWGPAITSHFLSWKANLLFAASYRDPASHLPIFSAVVIRGTDTSAGFLGVLTQMKEDLEPGCQLIWPGGDGPCATGEQSFSATPYMARGTFKGFNDLIGLQGVNHSPSRTSAGSRGSKGSTNRGRSRGSRSRRSSAGGSTRWPRHGPATAWNSGSERRRARPRAARR